MSQAGPLDIENSNPQIPTSFTTNDGTAVPIGNELEVLGNTVTNGTHTEPTWTTGSGNTVTVNLQLGAAITGAPADSNDAGLVSFDDTQFTVDANGFVQLLAGGAGIETITGDIGGAISSDGAGNFNLIGSIVANGTNAKPLAFDGLQSANSQVLELQLSSTTTTPADSNDAGICSFDQSQFTVDSNGFVQLVSVPSNTILTNEGDDGVMVSPDGAGNFKWIGQAVANATHSKPVYFKDSATLNAIDLDVQVATERTGAPADSNDAGICSFDDTIFSVDANGYVSTTGGTLVQSITGGPGVTISGTSSVPIVNSVIFTDTTATTLSSDNGYFATAAGTYNLPASPAQGELIHIIADTSGAVVVDAPSGDFIRIGNQISSDGGTATSNAIGDSLTLRFRNSSQTWIATAVQGTWTIA